MAKKANRRQLLVNLFCFFICVGCIVSLCQAFEPIIVYRNEINVLEQQKFSVLDEISQLEQEIDLLNDTDYITRYARENYVFTREGEQVTIIPGGN